MKNKINLINLLAIIVYTIILNGESGICKAFNTSATDQSHHHADDQSKEYKLNAQVSEAMGTDINYREASTIESYDQHHQHESTHSKEIAVTNLNDNHHHTEPTANSHYHFDLHLKELTESAKNPENLKNGIYQNGAVTYDLGLPHYEILNPHDPPEIITSDHPHYHQHLNHIQKTNNFTLEDFDVTSMPSSDSAADTAATTTELPETTTTSSVLTTTLSKDCESIKNKIDKELSTTKDKIQKIDEQNKFSTSSQKKLQNDVKFVIVGKKDNLRRKLRPSPFRVQTPKYEQQQQPQHQQSSQKSTKQQIYKMQSNVNTAQISPNNEVSNENSPITHMKLGGMYTETVNIPYTYQIGNTLPAQSHSFHKVHTPSAALSPAVSYEYLSNLQGNRNYFPGQAVYKSYTVDSPSPVAYKHWSPTQQNAPSYVIERNLDRLYRSASFLNDFKR